jgi:hypothetical protein
MWSGEEAGKLREKRGVEWCAEIARGRPPFIAARGCRGCTGQVMVATVFWEMKGQGSGRVVLATSRWS